MNQPFISIIIPVKDIGYFAIFENLPHMDKQTYRNFEVILLPDIHTPYDLVLLKKYKWLRIIPTGTFIMPPQKRNRGVDKSKGDIVTFIDDDAYPTKNWLEQTVKAFKEKKTAAVCGPGILPPNVNHWEKAFNEILKTYIGSGGYGYRFTPQKERYVDDYPSMNFSIKKKIFKELGGFNTYYWPGEDSKLCEHLVYEKDGKIFYDPEIVVYHHRRTNLLNHLKQHGRYGYHRGMFFADGDKNSRRLVYLFPTFLNLYVWLVILALLFQVSTENLSVFATIIFIPLLFYAAGASYLFLKAFFYTLNFRVSIISALILFLTHSIYGIMFVIGYFKAFRD